MSRFRQRRIATALAALAALLFSATASARDTTPQSGVDVTDGTVYAIEQVGGNTVLGGDFDYVGAATGAGVPFTRAGVPLRSGYAQVTGWIEVAVDDGAGGVFVGGRLDSVGGVNTRGRYLVHIRADGSFDSSWNPAPNGFLTRLVRDGSTLYAAGYFTTVGGQPRRGLAAIDVATGAATSWDPAPSSRFAGSLVDALQLEGSTLYVGGSFTTIAGQPRPGIAAVDTSTGALTAWSPVDLSGEVSSIATAAGRVYLAGSLRPGPFSLTTDALAYDATTGERYLGWWPNVNHSISLLQARGTTIYASGDFTTVDGQPRRGLAALDADDGTLRSWDPNPNGRISTLALADDNLVVGGSFTEIAGQARLRVAAFDGADALLPWNVAASGDVRAVAATGRHIYLGGDFHSVGGTIRHNLAALDAAGRLLPWAPDPDNTVQALERDGSRLAAGGFFTTVAGQPRRGLAAFDTSSGSLLSWAPSVDGYVYSLLAHDGRLYTGGWFRAIDGQPRSGLATFDLADGRLTPWSVDVSFGRGGGAPITGVRALAVLDGALYLGGLFEEVDGVRRWSLAAVDVDDGSLLPWDPEAIGDGRPIPQGRIYTLQAGGGSVYVGGRFTTGAGDQANAAALDAVTGARSGTLPSSAFSTNVMLLDGSTLYLATESLRAIDLTTGLTTWDVSPYSEVHALSLAGTRLDVGGSFASIGLSPTSGYARFPD
ncbi:hypothetical protein VSS74_02135 [Conexibacter stalactiti]|uniref:Outer membrane protein assembly factor BamB n=1 Tax=Conexibacter stalactiti TaxID=1940611 RepID=A0ABU4HM51_9ACTN|nr:hypothetical protein [Conexibacter stalactiti]MDW5593119.1 hypothetical protein [Conexibacter stalactiti]MEC5033760.1 hypothetical protein [Conexibacter stalactiti]